MAGRIRTIKPEILDDEPAAALSDAAWRLWVSSWVLADDHGRFRAGGRYLAANIWMGGRTAQQAEDALAELVRSGFARRYLVEGQLYAQLKPRGWRHHQRIDKPGKPRVPVPTDRDFIDGERTSRRGRVAEIPDRSGRIPGSDHPIDDDHASSDSGSPGLESSGIQNSESNDSTNIDAVSRDFENSSPRARARARAGPPTSDLRPPTNDQRPSEKPADAGGDFQLQLQSRTEADTKSPLDTCWNAYLAAWRSAVGRGSPPKLTQKRRAMLRARLKDGFSVEQLSRAARNLFESEFHVQRGFTGPRYAWRDADAVERFQTRPQSAEDGAWRDPDEHVVCPIPPPRPPGYKPPGPVRWGPRPVPSPDRVGPKRVNVGGGSET